MYNKKIAEKNISNVEYRGKKKAAKYLPPVSKGGLNVFCEVINDYAQSLILIYIF